MLFTNLEQYVEENIIPLYNNFDKAHGETHVRKVIANSLGYAKYFTVNTEMVYIVAVYHDVGLQYGREKHHIDSGKILLADSFLQKYFTEEQLGAMAMAVEDHRASNKYRPRNDYGLIVAEADKDIAYETILQRTIQYSLAKFPQFTKEEHYLRTKGHLVGKYGREGYLSLWLPFGKNVEQLAILQSKLDNPAMIQKDFDTVFLEEFIDDEQSS